MKLDIKWTNDCQGKKDYDGEIVAVSTRYWPGHMTVFDSREPEKGFHEVPAGNPSAHCSITLSDGLLNGEYEDLIEADFKGDTFEEVAAHVEVWAQEQMNRVEKALRAEFQPQA